MAIATSTLLLIASATAAAAGAYGTVQQGNAIEAQSKSAALLAERDSDLQEANAAVTLLQSSANEEAQRRDARRRLGAMRGEIAQSGSGLLGSNADIYSQSARDAELDALNIRYAGITDSKGLINQSTASQFNAGSLRAEGRASRQGASLRAGTQLLTSGTDIYNTYRKPAGA